jgi:hypothetical protein
MQIRLTDHARINVQRVTRMALASTHTARSLVAPSCLPLLQSTPLLQRSRTQGNRIVQGQRRWILSRFLSSASTSSFSSHCAAASLLHDPSALLDRRSDRPDFSFRQRQANKSNIVIMGEHTSTDTELLQ